MITLIMHRCLIIMGLPGQARARQLLDTDTARTMDSIVQASIAAQARLQQAEAHRAAREASKRADQAEARQHRGLIDTEAAEVGFVQCTANMNAFTANRRGSVHA